MGAGSVSPWSFRHLFGRVPAVRFRSPFDRVSEPLSWKGCGTCPTPSGEVELMITAADANGVSGIGRGTVSEQCRNRVAKWLQFRRRRGRGGEFFSIASKMRLRTDSKSLLLHFFGVLSDSTICRINRLNRSLS